jgi:hypothetical protein
MGNFIQLYKSAKKKRTEEEERAHREAKEDRAALIKANIGGTLASMTAGPALGAAMVHGAGKLKGLEDAHLEELAKSMHLENKLDVVKPIKKRVSLLSENAYFMPKSKKEAKKSKTIGKVTAHSKRLWKPGVIGHELGHASIHDGHGIASFLQKHLYGPTRLANGLGLGVLPTAAAYHLNKDEESPVMAALKGGLVGAAANAGMLIPELEASRRGIKHLLKSSLSPKQKLLNSLTLLPAFSTYLLGAAAPSAIAGAMSSSQHKKRKQEHQERAKQEEFKDKVASFIKASNDIDMMFDKKVEVNPKDPFDGRLKKNKAIVEFKDKDLDLPKLHHHKIKIALERLKGGKGDSKEDKEFPRLELLKGIKHEQEHTGDKAVAKEIAKDHLSERKDYYSALDEAHID